MAKRKTLLRDFIRGYSDADIKSAGEAILKTPFRPSAITYLTTREFNAYRKEGLKILGNVNGKAHHSIP